MISNKASVDFFAARMRKKISIKTARLSGLRRHHARAFFQKLTREAMRVLYTDPVAAILEVASPLLTFEAMRLLVDNVAAVDDGLDRFCYSPTRTQRASWWVTLVLP